MNGPEHYAKAEFCFAEADRHGPSYEDTGLWLELGGGHALLAIAAALAQQVQGQPGALWAAALRATNPAPAAPDAGGVWQTAQAAEDAADRAATAEWGPA